MEKSQFPASEWREYEQYFFTENVLTQWTESLQYENNILCLCTPAVADAFHRLKEKTVVCIDIDERFNYWPSFIQCDITLPNPVVPANVKPDLIIVDPPFFKMKLLDLFNYIELLTKGDRKTKIVFAFVIREEKSWLGIFKDYNLKWTKFKLEYDKVDKTKWGNYGIYSNFESGRIKYLNKNNK